MTVYVFQDPLRLAIDFGKSKIPTYPAGTTVSDNFPTDALTHQHVQIGWDGTPGERQQVETAAIRVTVWGPAGQRTSVRALASLVRRDFLTASGTGFWRVTRGAGRAPGTDPDTGNEFCTFTVNADTRPA